MDKPLQKRNKIPSNKNKAIKFYGIISLHSLTSVLLQCLIYYVTKTFHRWFGKIHFTLLSVNPVLTQFSHDFLSEFLQFIFIITVNQMYCPLKFLIFHAFN